jgi:hypothetical protein
MKSTLDSLLKAKRLSDKKRYDEKTEILRKLMAEKPDEFFVDSRLGQFYGVTHRPTGFRIHTVGAALPAIKLAAILASHVRKSRR